MARVKVTSGLGPRWGSNKKKDARNQRERDLANKVFQLENDLAEAKQTLGVFASDDEIAALEKLVSMPYERARQLGVVVQLDAAIGLLFRLRACREALMRRVASGKSVTR